MKIAIPTFGTRVSPRFDCASDMLVVTIDEQQPPRRERVVASTWAAHERVNKLARLGVDTVLCGGVDRWSSASLRCAGIAVYGWIVGEVEEVLDAFLRGDFDLGGEDDGGCGRCRRRRRGPPPEGNGRDD